MAASGMLAAAVMEASAMAAATTAAAGMAATGMAAAGVAAEAKVAAGMAVAEMAAAATAAAGMAAAAKVAAGLGSEGTRLPSKRLAFSTYWVVDARDMCRILTFFWIVGRILGTLELGGGYGKAVGLWDSYRSPPPRIWGLAAASRCILERSYVTAILTVVEARDEKRAVECT